MIVFWKHWGPMNVAVQVMIDEDNISIHMQKQPHKRFLTTVGAQNIDHTILP